MHDVTKSRSRFGNSYCATPPRRRAWLLAGLTATLAACTVADADRIATGAWLDQHAFSDMACGPTAILNALRHRLPHALADADPRVIHASIARFGQAASDEYDGRLRWDPKEGVAPLDLTAWYNDERRRRALPEVQGTFLDRTGAESSDRMLRRIHGTFARSLAAGEPLLLRLRSFAPAAEAGSSEILWHGRFGHWVTVVGVQEVLAPHHQGFTFTFVDPDGANLRTAFAHLSIDRDFTAAKGNTQSWEWLEDRPFLVVAAAQIPGLGRHREPWHRRTLITFDYAIGIW